jgi:hypothetical protein
MYTDMEVAYHMYLNGAVYTGHCMEEQSSDSKGIAQTDILRSLGSPLSLPNWTH